MRAAEIRKLSDEELTKQLEETHHEVFNLRLRTATKQLTDYSQMRKVKRDIARIKTIIKERGLGRKT